MSTSLYHLFSPRSVAVVGVSAQAHKLGSIVYRQLQASHFPGKIYPVNPKYDQLDGVPVFPHVSAIPAPVDQVTICVPAAQVLEVVKDCVQAQVKSIIIISAGFAETGTQGQQWQDQIAALCRQHQITLIGPNVIGVLNPAARLNNSWMPTLPSPGQIAFVSQSGALCCSLLDVASQLHLGFHHFCSLGNKAGLDELDLFRFWQADDQVQVIAAYLEQISRGQELVDFLAHECTKPVIILKAGQTATAHQAINSHTGSLAGPYRTIQTGLTQAGAILAHDFTDLCQLLLTFSYACPPPTGHRLALVTNAGGAGILATDQLDHHQLQLAHLTTKTKQLLSTYLPSAASLTNPVDLLGDASAERYFQAGQLLVTDPQVDSILFLLTPQAVTDVNATARAIVKLAHQHPHTTLAATFLGGDRVQSGINILRQAKIIAHSDLHQTLRCLSVLTHTPSTPSSTTRLCQLSSIIGQGTYQPQVQTVTTAKTTVLTTDLTAQLLHEVKLDLPAEKLVTSLAEAQAFAQKYPQIVLKIPNHLLAHKTESQGVYLHLTTPNQVAHAYHQLTDLCRSLHQPTLILAQEQISAQAEMLIGANRDGSSQVYQPNQPGFGHLLVFGQGGIYTEIYQDTAACLVPASRPQLAHALRQTKIHQLFAGVRGQPALAKTQILDTLCQVQKLLLLYPQIVSLDLNPVLITPKRAVIVDAKIFVAA